MNDGLYLSVAVDLARIRSMMRGKTGSDESYVVCHHGMLQSSRGARSVRSRFDNRPGENLPSMCFPLPGEYVQILADYVTARAEMTDVSTLSRACGMFMTLFASGAAI